MQIDKLIKDATIEANRVFNKDKEKWGYWMKILHYAKKLKEANERSSVDYNALKRYALDRFFGRVSSSQYGDGSMWYRRVGKNYFTCGTPNTAFIGIVDGDVLVKFEKVLSEEDKNDS